MQDLFVKAAGVLGTARQVNVRAAGVNQPQQINRAVATATPAAVFDYQTGDFSQWTAQQVATPGVSASIVTTPARAGYPKTAKFVSYNVDNILCTPDLNRAEVYADQTATGNPAEGVTQWYSWSIFLPTGTVLDDNIGAPWAWCSTTQWHHDGNTGNPNLAVQISQPQAGSQWRILTSGTDPAAQTGHQWECGAYATNEWTDFVVKVVWSSSDTTGHLIVKINGVTKVDATCATLYTGQSAYLKQGIYRSDTVGLDPFTIYYTGTRRGPTEASVAL